MNPVPSVNRPQSSSLAGRRRRLALGASLLLAGGLVIGTVRAAAPDFQITSPVAGATITGPVVLKVAVSGAEIGTPGSGNYHLHVSVDHGMPQPLYKNVPEVFDLPPGPHSITVNLGYANHRIAVPDKTVAFTVK